MDAIFAIKALAGLVGCAIGTVAGSLIAAIWLRLAAKWLQIANIPYLTAFKSTLISNFIVLAFNFSVGVNHGLTVAMLKPSISNRNFQTIDFSPSYPPTYFVYATVLALLMTAAIFRKTIPNNDTVPQISFGDSFALASFYFALSFGFMLVLALIALNLVLGLLFLLGSY